ncbi:unnamed protein product [Meloidogyne enterolobii]|uniref:Uncharacterized protein n=1 Tax=Meloidogyne enterolobii TaxID=390850 RepID=A0ACB0YBK2_MELEN
MDFGHLIEVKFKNYNGEIFQRRWVLFQQNSFGEDCFKNSLYTVLYLLYSESSPFCERTDTLSRLLCRKSTL